MSSSSIHTHVSLSEQADILPVLICLVLRKLFSISLSKRVHVAVRVGQPPIGPKHKGGLKRAKASELKIEGYKIAQHRSLAEMVRTGGAVEGRAEAGSGGQKSHKSELKLIGQKGELQLIADNETLGGEVGVCV